MQRDERFSEAIKKIDAANQEDPRSEMVDGRPQPRELLFAQRVYQWVEQLAEDPSEELLLAARAHTLRRWMIPRDRYPMTTVGYHQWRNALAQFHADEAETILHAAGYPAEQIQSIKDFITKKNWPENKEACVLEDADCLVFLETKLSDYIDDWQDTKTLRILQRTIRKMTPEARTRAFQLKLGERERELVHRAANPATE
ncbi:MAG: DUF4202 domain-containing protein [Planctomycetes bacterium]|nr:DUF4202 domain-containing protein [Planctomycetota bacterium]